MSVEISGIEEVERNLSMKLAAIEGDISQGMIVAGDMIKRETVKITPEEFGPLRQSAYKRLFRRASGPEMAVGFRAEYAPYVHEMPMKNRGKRRTGPGAKGTYWDSGENKFLEKTARRFAERFIEIVKKYARF